MAVETVAVTCNASTWTALSSGQANVLLKLRKVVSGYGYLFIGTSAPTEEPPTQNDYLTIEDSDTPSFSSLSGTDNVYFFSPGAAIVEVVRG